MTDTVQVPREATKEMLQAMEVANATYIAAPKGYWPAVYRALLAAAPQATDPRDVALCWTKGEPPKYIAEHWFIAETTYGDRLVLRALPEEYTYDYTTADATYIKANKVKRWMQFPDSEFKSPAETAIATLTAERDALRERIVELEMDNRDFKDLLTRKPPEKGNRAKVEFGHGALTTQPSKTETRDDQ